MAVLTAHQIRDLTTIHDDDSENCDLWVPRAQAANLSAQRENELYERACWNWALSGGVVPNNNDPRSAPSLYENNNPINWRDDSARAALDTSRFNAHVHHEPNIAAQWLAAKQGGSSDDAKLAFMRSMLRIAARANGLTPANGATPYELHMTVPRGDWYHWQHFALSFHSAGQERFIQTEPNIPINWGFRRIWEADRDGHLTTSTFLNGIRDAHVEVINIFLSLPRCRTCHRVKARTTSFLSRWHRCSGPNHHVHCGACGKVMPTYAIYSRSRQCGAAGCGNVTDLMDDDAR